MAKRLHDTSLVTLLISAGALLPFPVSQACDDRSHATIDRQATSEHGATAGSVCRQVFSPDGTRILIEGCGHVSLQTLTDTGTRIRLRSTGHGNRVSVVTGAESEPTEPGTTPTRGEIH